MITQVSPIRDILVRDFNQDGKMDLALVGNDYSPKPSIGRNDASYGWCLLGDTSHVYKPLMPVISGLIVKGDARRIIPIDVSGKHYIVTAVNNGNLQLFRLAK